PVSVEEGREDTAGAALPATAAARRDGSARVQPPRRRGCAGEARYRERQAGASERRPRSALPRIRSRSLDEPHPGARRRARPRRDVPRHDGEDGALGEGALRDRRLRPLRVADRPGDPAGRADGAGRRRQDLRRPPRQGHPHPDGRGGHRCRDAQAAARADRGLGRRVIAAAARIDSGDTAWMIVATALVLMMTPALGLFYAGLVRSKNTLNTFMMSIAALGVVALAWAFVGYSLAFSTGNAFIGDFHFALLRHVGYAPRTGVAIPH